MMHRRTLLGLLALGPLAWRNADAQPADKRRRVGHLVTGPPGQSPPANWDSFVQGLRESGHVEGHNIVFEHRYAGGRPEVFPDLAADLARRKMDVIFARGPWAVRAAKKATSTIPIVGIDLESDPIEEGFVHSLARPGGNITGLFLDLAEISGKQLQFLSEIIPKLSRVAVLGDPVVNSSQVRALRLVAQSLAVEIHAVDMKRGEDLEGAFEAVAKGRARALIVLSNPLTLSYRAQIATRAAKRAVPTMHLYRAHVELGGLLSYGPDLPEMFRGCGIYVGRILGGAKPGDMPVERPTKFELVINMKTAKALGLTIPPSLLLRADQVIDS